MPYPNVTKKLKSDRVGLDVSFTIYYKRIDNFWLLRIFVNF